MATKFNLTGIKNGGKKIVFEQRFTAFFAVPSAFEDSS